jgi:hypothetical protein
MTMKRQLFVTLTTLLFLTATILAGAHAAAAQDFRVEGAGLQAVPTSYSGPCPGLITFKGKIQASAAGRVKYTYSYSDGGSGPEGYVDFDAPGVKLVETTWRLGDASTLPRYEGWAILKVTSPNAYESNQAKFVLECRQGGGGSPQPPRQQPQPNPDNQPGEGQSDNQELQREIEKQRAERKRKLEREAEVLKAFSERVRPKLEEAAQKVGFDAKAAEDELRAIASETNGDKQRQRGEEYSRKYGPQFKKLIQVSGIDVAAERRQLIAALGLNPAKVKPSDTLTLEIEGDAEEVPSSPIEAPPEEGARWTNQFGAYFVKASFPQDYRTIITPPLTRPVTWGDGVSFYNPYLGRVTANTRRLSFFDHSDAGTMLFGRFNLNFGVRRMRVTAEVAVDNYVTAYSVYAYSTAETFTGLNVECGSVTVGRHTVSMGRVIAPVFGFPFLAERRSRVVSFEFNPEFVPNRQCLVGVSAASTAGVGGLIAQAYGTANVTLQRVTILGWYR